MTTYYDSAWFDIKVCAEMVRTEGPSVGHVKHLVSELVTMANGTADGKIDTCYYRHESAKAASSTTQYDLNASLTDAFGQTKTFAEVVMIAVLNRRTTALAYLIVGPHTATPFGRLSANLGFWPADIAADNDQGEIVGPALSDSEPGMLILYDPTGVPAGAGATDIFSVICSAVVGATNEWDILILGRSA